MSAHVDDLVPDRQSILPYLLLGDTRAAIAFYERAFGARRRLLVPGPAGQVVHAEIDLGRSRVWMADEAPELGFPGPATLGAPGVLLFVYVEDVEALAARATGAGAETLRPLADQPWGDRTVTLRDPFGHVWTFAQRRERLSAEEALKRMGLGS